MSVLRFARRLPVFRAISLPLISPLGRRHFESVPLLRANYAAQSSNLNRIHLGFFRSGKDYREIATQEHLLLLLLRDQRPSLQPYILPRNRPLFLFWFFHTVLGMLEHCFHDLRVNQHFLLP